MSFFRSPWPIVILIVLVILLFGANKLPGLARNMGKSMRVFKSEVDELRGDEDEEEAEEPRSRSSRDRDDRSSREDRDDRRSRDDRDDRDDRRARDEREYDPRDEDEPESVRHREDGDSYRRD